MKNKFAMLRNKGSMLFIVGVACLGANPAFALALPIPEPSALALYGAGVAGVAIAVRLMKRK